MNVGAIRKLCEDEIGEIGEPEDEAPDSDDFNPADAFGGNFDDSYEGGIAKGRADLAREILKHLT